MGIKNLNKLLKEHCVDGITEMKIRDLKGKFVAIDTSIFLYKYTFMGNMLQAFTQQLNHFLKNKITPVYLFDGKPTEDKRDLINERKAKYKKKAQNILDLKEQEELLMKSISDLRDCKDKADNKVEIIEQIQKLSHDLTDLTNSIKKKEKGNIRIDFSKVKILKDILTSCGIYYYQCPGETDIYVKEFFKNGLIDYVITEDLDFITHRCPKILYGYNYCKGKITLYDSKKIIEELEMSNDSFIDLCILMGCDYSKTVKRLGVKTAWKLIKKHESIEEIISHNKKFEFTEAFEYQKARNMFNLENDLDVTKKDVQLSKNKCQILVQILTDEKIKQKHIDNLVKVLNKTKPVKKANNIMKFMKKKKKVTREPTFEELEDLEDEVEEIKEEIID